MKRVGRFAVAALLFTQVGSAWADTYDWGSVAMLGVVTPNNFCTSDGILINCSTSTINLATQVTGYLSVSNGGTGANTAAGAVSNLLSSPASGTYQLSCTGTGCTPVAVASGTQYQFAYYAATGTAVSGNANIYTNASNDFIVSAGKIGIGTATPANTLDVTGTGIHIADGVPGTPTNSLYASGGDLYWNGYAIADGSGGWMGGTITVPSGGTGQTSLTAHGVLVGNGTDAVNVTSAGNTGTVFQGVTGADPVFSADLTYNGIEANPLGADYTTTGAQSGVNLGTSSSMRYAGTAAATFYGIAGGANGKVLRLHNASSYILTLSNQSTNEGTAGNRIITGTGADMPVPANTSVSLQYDATSARWRVTGSSNAAKALAAGSTTQVQYNDAGDMAGAPGLIYDKTNARTGVGSSTPVATLDVNGPVKMAGTGAEACNSTNIGMVRYNASLRRLEACRGKTTASFSVSFTTTPIGTSNQTAAAFQFASAIVGDTFTYQITSSGGGGTVSGAGTISSSSQSVSGIDVSALGDGSLTLQASLTSPSMTSDGFALAHVVKTTTGLGCSSVGDTCSDGTIYAGTDAYGVLYTTPCDLGMTGTHNSCSGTRLKYTWNDGSATPVVEVGNYAQNATNGMQNTTTLYNLGTSPAPAPYQAARACVALGSAWYLPSKMELNMMYENQTAIGGFIASGYWSSTEWYSEGSFYQNFSTGAYPYTSKTLSYYVRCVRR